MIMSIMSYDLPAFLQRIAAFLSHFTANPPGNDQILQPSPGTAEPMALPAMARCIFIAAVGWPDWGEAWSNSSGNFHPQQIFGNS